MAINFPAYCANCAMGGHQQCTGERTAFGKPCQCGLSDHEPSVKTAAAMRRFMRPDLAKLPDDVLAASWHEATER